MEKVFRDPVHNLIGFDRTKDRLILDLIETREVQRLRSIKLMGVSYVVYPGADHNRFSHSLGAAFLMKRIIERIEKLRFEPQYQEAVEKVDQLREILISAALLHDIGHFPFSHLLEHHTHIEHELWTTHLIRNPESEVHQVLKSSDKKLPSLVAAIIERTFKPAFAVKLISSQLDVDRMDYLLRDSHHTGVGYGRFDLEWLIHSLRIVAHNDDWEIAVDGEKGFRAVESYLLSRYHMQQQVYYHKTGRAAGVMLLQILKRAAHLLDRGEKIFCTEPLAKLISKPQELDREEFMRVDDVVLGHAIKEWAHTPDAILSDLCSRFGKRELFKSLRIQRQSFEDRQEQLFELARSSGFDPNYYLGIDRAVSDPYTDSFFGKAEGKVGESIYLVDKSMHLTELSERSEIFGTLRNQLDISDRLCFPGELRDQLEACFFDNPI